MHCNPSLLLQHVEKQSTHLEYKTTHAKHKTRYALQTLLTNQNKCIISGPNIFLIVITISRSNITGFLDDVVRAMMRQHNGYLELEAATRLVLFNTDVDSVSDAGDKRF